jgi:hypothetical protein
MTDPEVTVSAEVARQLTATRVVREILSRDGWLTYDERFHYSPWDAIDTQHKRERTVPNPPESFVVVVDQAPEAERVRLVVEQCGSDRLGWRYPSTCLDYFKRVPDHTSRRLPLGTATIDERWPVDYLAPTPTGTHAGGWLLALSGYQAREDTT